MAMDDLDAFLARHRKTETPKAKSYGVGEAIQDLGVNTLKGSIAVGQGAAGLANILTGGLTGKALDAVGYDSQATNQVLNNLHTDPYLQGQQAVQQAGEIDGSEWDKGRNVLGALVANPMQAVGTAVESIPLMLPGLGVQQRIYKAATAGLEGAAKEAAIQAAMPKLIAAGAGMEGLQASGSIADQAQQAGQNWSDYALPALGGGAVTGGIAAASGLALGDVAASLIAKKGFSPLKGAVTEGLVEELPQSINEQVATNIAMGNPNIWEGTGAQGVQGAVAGGLMGGVMGGSSGILSRAAEQLPQQDSNTKYNNNLTATDKTEGNAQINQNMPEYAQINQNQQQVNDLFNRFGNPYQNNDSVNPVNSVNPDSKKGALENLPPLLSREQYEALLRGQQQPVKSQAGQASVKQTNPLLESLLGGLLTAPQEAGQTTELPLLGYQRKLPAPESSSNEIQTKNQPISIENKNQIGRTENTQDNKYKAPIISEEARPLNNQPNQVEATLPASGISKVSALAQTQQTSQPADNGGQNNKPTLQNVNTVEELKNELQTNKVSLQTSGDAAFKYQLSNSDKTISTEEQSIPTAGISETGLDGENGENARGITSPEPNQNRQPVEFLFRPERNTETVQQSDTSPRKPRNIESDRTTGTDGNVTAPKTVIASRVGNLPTETPTDNGQSALAQTKPAPQATQQAGESALAQNAIHTENGKAKPATANVIQQNEIQQARVTLKGLLESQPKQNTTTAPKEAVPNEQPAPVVKEKLTTEQAKYSIDDINQQLARNAFYWTSFDPEKRGESARQSYVSALETLENSLKQQYEQATQEQQQAFDNAFGEIINKFKELYKAYLVSHSNVASTMIAGPANFNTERNRKRSDAADNKQKAAYEYLEKAQKRLEKIFKGQEDNSLEGQLKAQEQKLEQLKANHEIMKAANIALRKNDDAKLKELGFTDEQITELKTPYLGSVGYQKFTLTNNLANIKRVEDQIAIIKKRISTAQKAESTTETEQESLPFKMVQNTAENRLQLFFDGKPDEETRNLLKAAAFKWSPKNMAWQRQLTANAITAASQIAEKIKTNLPKYSQTKTTPANAHTATSLKDELSKVFGQAWLNRLLSTGKFKIISRADAKGMGVNDNAQAFYNPKDDSTYFVADNIDQSKDLKKLFLHELGVHALQLGKNSAQFKGILTELQNLIDKRGKSSKVLQAAIAAAKNANTPQDLFLEEVAGYLVEFHPNLSISQKIIEFFRAMLRNFRIPFFEVGIREESIVYMAHSALRTAPESLLFNGDVKGNTRQSNQQKKIAAWTYSRIKRLLNMYAYEIAPSETKALAVYVSPDEFLKATTTPEILSRLEKEASTLNQDDLMNETQPIFLQGQLSGFQTEFTIRDHEGRHRMIALRNAGITRVPIVLEVQSRMPLDFISTLDVVGQSFQDGKGEGFTAKYITPISYDYRDNLIDEFKADGKEDIRYSLANDVTDFFTGKPKRTRTLRDINTLLNTRKPQREKPNSQYWKDILVTNLTDHTRPFDRFIMDSIGRYSEEAAATIIRAKDRAVNMKKAYEKQALDKFGRPLTDAIRAIVKETKIDFETARDLTGFWMSAVYAPEANAWLLQKDQNAIDDLEQEKYDAIQAFKAIQDPSDSSRAKLDAKLDALDKQIQQATEKRNQRKKAIERQQFVDLPAIKQELVELRKDRVANVTEITRLEKILAENVGLAGGLNNFTAAKIQADIEKAIPRDLLKTAARPVYAMLKWKLENDIKDGKVSRDTVKTWLNSHNYVPLTGDPRTDDSIEDGLAGNINQAKDYGIEGRTTSIAENGIDAAFKQVEKSARYHGWNEFKTAIHSLYNSMLADRMAEGLNQAEAIQELWEEYGIKRRPTDTNIPPDENSIIYRKDNKGFVYTLNNQGAMEALRGLNNENVPSILKPIQAFTSLQARMVTILMVGFAPTNTLKDVLEKSENIRTRKVPGLNDSQMNQVGRDTLTNAARLLTKLKTIAAVLAEDTPMGKYLRYEPTDTDAQQLKDYLRLGGNSTFGLDIAEDINNLSEHLHKIQTFSEKTWEALLTYNSAFETISGFSVYQALLKQGIKPELAATQALNLMNFNKRGKILSPLRSLYMFLNPTAQGAHQLARTLSTKRGQIRFAAYTLAAFVLYTILRSGEDDDEGLYNRMDEQSNFLLYRNIHIPIPGGGYVKIPVGFGMQQLAWAHGVNLVRMSAGQMTAGEFLGESALLWQKAAMPIAPAESSFTQNPAVFLAQTFTPQIFRPIANVALDRTAFGSPLTLARYEKQDTAKALQGKKTTPEEYKQIALAFSSMGLDVYPEQVKELVRGYIIGHAGDVLKAVIENPNAEKLGRHVVSPSFDRWVTAQNDDMIRNRLYYRLRDQMKEASIKRSVGDDLTPEEAKLAELGDKVSRMENRARGKYAAASKAQRLGQSVKAERLRNQGDKIRDDYMEFALKNNFD